MNRLLFKRKICDRVLVLDCLHISGCKGIRSHVVQGDEVINWKLSEVPLRLQIADLILIYIKMKNNSRKENKCSSSYLCNVFLSLHLNIDFKISPWFLGEYPNLELDLRLKLPLRLSFWHYSSKMWRSQLLTLFIDQNLTTKRCEEVRLLHALKKLILTIMRLIILKKIWIFFLEFQIHVSLKET